MATFGKALQQGLDILELIRESPVPVLYSDLLSRSGMAPASFARFLKILVERGYVEKLEGGGYRPGWQLAVHGQAALNAMPLRAAAHSHLLRIVDQTGETAEIIEFRGNEFLVLDRVESPQAIQLRAQPGSLMKIGANNAIGRLAMAHGLTGSGRLRNRSAIRSSGYAACFQNNDTAWRGAAAIYRADGTLSATVTVAAPAFRITPDKEESIERLLRFEADAMSRSLGFQQPTPTGATA